MGTARESSLCVDIVEAIATVEGVRPGNLGFSLHHHVSTDAIERLAKHKAVSWELRFDVPGHVVTVRDDRTILVDGDVVQTAR